MATTTKKAPPCANALNSNPLTGIAEAHEIKYALEEMFYDYVWSCTGRDEEKHNIICFVFHGLMHECDKIAETEHQR